MTLYCVGTRSWKHFGRQGALAAEQREPVATGAHITARGRGCSSELLARSPRRREGARGARTDHHGTGLTRDASRPPFAFRLVAPGHRRRRWDTQHARGPPHPRALRPHPDWRKWGGGTVAPEDYGSCRRRRNTRATQQAARCACASSRLWLADAWGLLVCVCATVSKSGGGEGRPEGPF